MHGMHLYPFINERKESVIKLSIIWTSTVALSSHPGFNPEQGKRFFSSPIKPE
jgi:hypothetical protein